MRHIIRGTGALHRWSALLLGPIAALGLSAAAYGQEPSAVDPDEVEPSAQAEEPANADDGRSELERARDELAEARRNLEAAAREVARLSARAVGPIVGDIRRQWFNAAGRRAMVGLNVENADDGARVVGVSPGGPADEAGLRTGDVIVAIDGIELDTSDSPSGALISRLSEVEPGTDVELRVLRDGELRDFVVTTRARDREVLSWEGPRALVDSFDGYRLLRPFGRWQSMELVTLSPELGEYFGTSEGLLVVRAPQSDDLPLRDGDVILDIHGRVPSSPEHAMKILASFEPGETLRLTIMRQQRRETLEVTLPRESDEEDEASGGFFYRAR